jgi:hypothetical protein
VAEQKMIYRPRRRVIDLRTSLARGRDTGVQYGIATCADTIDVLLDQIARDRAAMTAEISRLRRQFSLDLPAVCAELRATKAELHRLQLINEFAALEHRDLSKPRTRCFLFPGQPGGLARDPAQPLQ